MIISAEEEFRKCKNHELIKFECDFCKSQYMARKSRALVKHYKTPGQSSKSIEWPLDIRTFCTNQCRYDDQKTGELKHCKECNEKIYVKLNHLKKRENHFCSLSCAATYNNNNRVYDKRVELNICKFENCSNNVEYKAATFCRSCKDLGRHYYRRLDGKLPNEITIEEYCSSKSGAGRFSDIRGNARASVKKSGRELKCEECGWDKHVEVCHIKAIADFPVTTFVSVVNDESNLRLLCPNCHWVFDNTAEKT